MTEISKVAYQVMWNRLISVVEEQAQALVRTAFSTSVREAGDLSAGVYDTEGRMLAQAVTGTPGHVNAMADAVAHFIRRITATCKGRMVMSVRCNSAISQNPFLLFRFDGGEVGDVIEVSWTDSREQSRTDSAPIAAAPSGA